MAALRHAAKRLCERALQQRGALVRSSVVAEQPRRLLLNGASPGRRPMSTSSISRKKSSAELELLELRFKETKEELFNLLIAVRRAQLYPQLSFEDIQTHRLITHLAAQVEPRPHDPNWRMYRRLRRLNDFNTITITPGYFLLLAYCMTTNMRETSKNSEANSVSEPDKDMN